MANPSSSTSFGPDFVSGLAPACEFLTALVWSQRSAVPDWRATLRLQAGGIVGTEVPDTPGFSSTPERFVTECRAIWQATSVPQESHTGLLRPGDRYASLAVAPVGALLMVGRFRLPPSADGGDGHTGASFSAPVITVINVPGVTSRGQHLEAATIWPGEAQNVFLEPGHVPRPEGTFFPLVGSFQADTRASRRESIVKEDYWQHDAVVWALDGLQATSALLVPSQVFDDPPTGAITYVDGPFWGSADSLRERSGNSIPSLPNLSDLDNDRPVWCCLPRALALPLCHDLPVGQCWATDIGREGFLASLTSMSNGVATLHQGWSECPLVAEWFALAAARPRDICVDLTPRSLIHQSLIASGATGAPPPVDRDLAYIDRLLAYRLHRDFALGAASTRMRPWFLAYEAKAHVDSFPASSYMGISPPSLCADLWSLRPPSVRAWRTGPPFFLQSFIDSALQPSYVNQYLRHNVAWNKDPPGLPLETREEAEERLMMEGEESDDDSLALRVRQSVCGSRSKSASIQSPSRPPREVRVSQDNPIVIFFYCFFFITEAPTSLPE